MSIGYDPTLVMLSILVAITAALTGLTVTVGYSPGAKRGTLGLLKGAVIIGGGIWSMHFIAMLAVKLPISVNYDFIETMISLYIAIAGTALGLFIAARRKVGFLSIPLGGILMGAAIGGMHYMGMGAMLSQQNLALIIATATFVICGVFLFLFSALAMGVAQQSRG